METSIHLSIGWVKHPEVRRKTLRQFPANVLLQVIELIGSVKKTLLAIYDLWARHANWGFPLTVASVRHVSTSNPNIFCRWKTEGLYQIVISVLSQRSDWHRNRAEEFRELLRRHIVGKNRVTWANPSFQIELKRRRAMTHSALILILFLIFVY